MTAAPPPPLRPLARSSEGRILTGVSAGLGRYTGIDPVVFRAAFAVLVLGSGVGVYLYLAAFLLMKAPRGGPGYVEQWTRRDFSGDTVFALLTAVLGFGLTVNLATVAFGTGTLVVAILMAVGLLAAHANGVDLLGIARSMPERLNRRRAATRQPPVAPAPPYEPFTSFDTGATPFGTPAAPFDTRAYEPAPAYRPAPPPEAQPSPQAARPQPEPEPLTEPIDEPVAARAEPIDEPATAEAEPGASPYVTRPHPNLAYGEPFAPHGPYQPLDPRRRAGHDPGLHPGETIIRPRRPAKRPRSYIGVLTFLLALFIGGVVVAGQITSASGMPSLTVVGGAMLITVGAGLLVATWWGRGAGLVALGTVLALTISAGLVLGGVPKRLTDTVWTPTSMAEVADPYQVGLGEATLDLTRLPLAAGSRTTFNASVTIGELIVVLPPTAQVEVHATARIGEIRVDHSVIDGTDIEVNRVLQPETPPEGAAATIVLRIKGGVGDVVVRRAA
ncbi:PspC domain-containing protein [Nonomuraea sp. NPDC050328]|uniref:PspC domain-containing protein n=1 Tax=Nonomuraea sp. NPDC050328 TaxID=3364361 RepID=UPI0037A3FACB